MNLFKERTEDFERKRIAGVKRALKGKPATESQRKARHEGLLKAWREGRIKLPILSKERRQEIADRRRGIPRPPHVIEALRKANVGRKISQETRSLMSENTRRYISEHGLNPKSLAAFEKWRRSDKCKEHCRRIVNDPRWRAQHSSAMRGRKWSQEIVERRVLPMRNRPQTAEKTKKGPTNANSLEGALRDAFGVIWRFRNLSHFVRTHEELFDPEDLILKRAGHGKGKRQRTCNAIKRLLCLFGRGKVIPGSWKGWTRVSWYEELKNDSRDLLNR